MGGLLDFSDNPRQRLMASGGMETRFPDAARRRLMASGEMDTMFPDSAYGRPQPVMTPPSLVGHIYGTADAYSGGLLGGLDNFVRRGMVGRTGVPRGALSAAQISNPDRAMSSAMAYMPDRELAIAPGIKAAGAAANLARLPLTKMLLSDGLGGGGAENELRLMRNRAVVRALQQSGK